MEVKFSCQVCSANGDISRSGYHYDSPGHHSFDSGLLFLDHLKRYHLVVKATQHGKLYFCCYGPSGFCASQLKSPTTSHIDECTSQSVFSSQREYEHHLLSQHLQLSAPLPDSQSPSSTNDLCKHSALHCPIKWDVYQSVVNLPAILNDPSHRQTDIFSRTWGESFERTEVTPSPRLPVIDERHFHKHLKKLDTSRVSAPTPIPHSRNSFLRTVHSSGLTQQSLVHPPLTNHSTSISLATIPSLLFASSFSLHDWSTFSQLIPLHPRLVPGDRSIGRMAAFDNDSGSPNQEYDFLTQHNRLANYLDVVEVHLAEQVSKKSSMFFEAVCCHDVIREQLCQALTQARRVRDQLRLIDSSITQPGMRLHRLVRRRANYRLLLEKLKTIASLQAVQPTIQLLLRGNDFCAALDLVTSTQDLLESLHRPAVTTSCGFPTPLQQIACLRHLDAQMLEIARLVRQMIEAEFEESVRQLLRPQSLDQPHSGSDLVSSLLGLLLIKRHDFVSAFRAELIRQVKQQHLNQIDAFLGERDISKYNSLAKDAVRSMSNEQWLKLVESVCAELKHLLARGEDVVALLVDAMSRCSSSSSICPSSLPNTTLTPTELDHLTAQLHLAIRTACGVAQCSIVDLIASCGQSPNGLLTSSETLTENDAPAVERLSLDDSVRLLTVLEDILEYSEHSPSRCLPNSAQLNGSIATEPLMSVIDVTDDRSGKSRMSSLTRIIFHLTRRVVTRFHTDRLSKLELVLNQERWQAVPVPVCVQQLVTQAFGDEKLGDLGTKLIACDRPPQSPTSRHRLSLKPMFGSTGGLDVLGRDGQVNSYLVLSGERFVVVGTVLMLLPILVDYCNLGEQLPCKPGSVFEVIDRVAELLNTFNSRTCQLVLGAEARRWADLQTISARNLALAFRSLQLVVQCFPILRLRLENLTKSCTSNMNWPDHSSSHNRNPKDPLRHVERLFREHIGQITDKLFNLLSNRMQDRLSVWYIRPPTPSPEFRVICRALSRVAEMTNDVLPEDTLTSILLRAHEQFKVQLRHRLSELSVVADGGPKQSLVDSELTYYVNQLRALTPQLATFSDDLDAVWPAS